VIFIHDVNILHNSISSQEKYFKYNEMFSIFKNSCYLCFCEQYVIQLFYVVASKATILKVCAEPLGLIARERHFAELIKE